MARCVAIVSGGMDSVTLAYYLKVRWGMDLTLLSVDYGQRHAVELERAKQAAYALDADHRIADLTSLKDLLRGSALTDDAVDVPEGHYADPTMALTVVPNRNAIMLNVAIGVAVAEGAQFVATGVHAGDHPVYPDCRPEFIDSLTSTAKIANEGYIHPEFRIVAPFVNLTKADIARNGDTLGVPFANTWSCYKGGETHCGRCSTCVERREAFSLAGVHDPTPYQDTEYWQEVVVNNLQMGDN